MPVEAAAAATPAEAALAAAPTDAAAMTEAAAVPPGTGTALQALNGNGNGTDNGAAAAAGGALAATGTAVSEGSQYVLGASRAAVTAAGSLIGGYIGNWAAGL
ncbi:MAG: hypothetical protein U1E53_10525 [Dongiaceae bacterium]